MPFIPRRDKAAGVFGEQCLGRALCGRFLFRGCGALRLHLAPFETHGQVVGRRVGTLVKQRYMLSVMCGRYTYKLTWKEIVRLYRLALGQPAQNTRARYNVCPTTTIDIIVDNAGERRLEQMRWGLVPSWWSKPLKDLKLATFNARAETIAEKPFFREASAVGHSRPMHSARKVRRGNYEARHPTENGQMHNCGRSRARGENACPGKHLGGAGDHIGRPGS